MHTVPAAEIFPGIFWAAGRYCVVVADTDTLPRFEQVVMPHLNAAYNLARWLMRNDHDAEDAVQDAYLRAFRFFDSFDGEDARAWLLAIVRNRCRSALAQTPRRAATAEFDEGKHALDTGAPDPESVASRKSEIHSLRVCIDGLPNEYREVIVLRELEQMSYKEVATAVAAPVGTVMSRLSRARIRLQECIASRVRREVRQ
jgi:RNA polymerase sigma-70 factor (ECF subfamily)